jgi:hypothetical protein
VVYSPRTSTRAQALAIPTTHVRRRIDGDKFRRAAQTVELDFIVFLAGPFIEPDDEEKSKYSPAAILRFRLFHLLYDAGFEVSLGEYRELIDSYKGELGEHHNAAVAELDHAQESASLVIMIPDSPGSFAEIGAFSLKDDICEKMIILSNVDHQASTGYLNTGPLACARSLGSEVHYIDFNNVSECFAAVKVFSDRVKSKMLLKRRLRG